MYRYKQVEEALAKLNKVPAEGMGAFKGRIIHLQRIGLTPEKPGRGNKISYTFEDVAKWALALELEEVGVDPMVVKTIIGIHWLEISYGLLTYPEQIDNIQYIIEYYIQLNPSVISDKPWLARVIKTDDIPGKVIGHRRQILINATHLRWELNRRLTWAVDPGARI